MRAVVAACLVALGGCFGGDGAPSASAPEDAVSKRLPLCAPYRGNANVWGYCVTKHAGAFPTAEDVAALCGTAGEWEPDCRHAWVNGRMQPGSGFSTEELLAVCDGGPDCAFELIDFRMEPEVTDQIAMCKEHAGPFADDCVGHALQMWWIGKPDAEEVARIAALDVGFPRKVGFQVAVSAFCSGVGSCDGHPDNQAMCETQLEIFRRRPETCPSQEWAVMDHNQQRGAPQGPGPAPGGPPTPGEPPSQGGPATPDDAAPSSPPPAPQPAGPPRHQPGTIPPPPGG